MLTSPATSWPSPAGAPEVLGRRHRRGSFTLIEFLGVLALMALLSGMAAVSLTSFLRHHAVEDAIERIRFADQAARDRAAAAGAARVLRVDLAAGEVRVLAEPGVDGATLATLPGGVRITDATIAGDRTGYGYLDVPIARTGLSPTYALRLRGQREQWVVIAGLTGHLQEVEREDVDTLLAPGGPDAD